MMLNAQQLVDPIMQYWISVSLADFPVVLLVGYPPVIQENWLRIPLLFNGTS
jgi:hypothetical protein